jgi:acyl transferase domain-containing protein
MSQLSRIEILKQLEKSEITSAQAFALLRQLGVGAGGAASLYYHRGWERSDAPAVSRPLGNVLVFDTNAGLRDALRQRGTNSAAVVLPGAGFRELADHVFEVNPASPADFEQLVQALEQHNLRPDSVVFRWAQEAFTADESRLKQALQHGVYAWLSLSQALVKNKLRQPLTLLHLVPDGAGEEQPHQEAVAGFFRSLRLENPNLLGKTLTVRGRDDLAGTILAELAIPVGFELEVRVENGTRSVKRFQETEAANATADLPLKERGVYLITGGLGGLGLLFAEHLAATVRARLVLTGRSDLNADAQAKIARLEALGSEVLYLSADVTNRRDVEGLVAQARTRFGKIDGVIHSAGVLRDSFLLKKTREEMDAVLAPKLFGTVNLDEATAGESLDFFVLFSSTAAVIGNVGQTDYAFGNAFMDSFAARRDELRARGQRTGVSLSFNWPLWAEGGMHVDADTVAAMKRQTGLVPLQKATGLAAFELALRAGVTQLAVLEGDANMLRRLIAAEREVPQAPAPVPSAATAETASAATGDASLRDRAEQFLKEILADAIKLSVDRIDADAPFENYGLDSVMIANLTREFEAHFGNLPKTLFFEYLTLGELAGYFAEQHAAKLQAILGLGAGETAAPQASAETAARVEATPQRKARNQSRPGRSRFAAAATASPQAVEEDEIAVIGVAGRYPEADDLDAFWANLKAGRDSVTEIPRDRWNVDSFFDTDRNQLGKHYSKWGGFINDVDRFDPLFFNISPSEAEFMDPQERLFLQTAYETLEDAGYTRERLDKSNVGVFVGAMYGHYQLFSLDAMRAGTGPAVGSFHSSIANRVSYHFNFSGPSIALDTMCSSSLTTIHLACESLRRGESDFAIAGGVNVSIHPLKYVLLSQTGFAASDGRCRTFGDGGDGYVPGEGVGAVLLKPLKKALADGDRIYAVIKSTTVNHGGKTNGFTVPNPNAQAQLIADALKKAKIDPRTLSYIEAHGTGTSLGDPIEIAGLMKAFRDYTKDKGFCSIGSVKSNIGHLESAAGIAGFTKVLLQMKHRELVPSLHADPLNSNIAFEDTAFHVQRDLRPWEQPLLDGKPMPRRAGISAFGAGGANAHIILEEYMPSRQSSAVANGSQLIVLSARDEDRLKEQAGKLARFLQARGLFRPAGEWSDADLRTALLEDLVRFAADVLNLGAEDVDADESLEEFGFDALRLAELAGRINQTYSLDLSPVALSDLASLNALADDLLARNRAAISGAAFGTANVTALGAELSLDEIAYTLQVGREAMEQRLAFVVSSTQELGGKLTRFAEGLAVDGWFAGQAPHNRPADAEVESLYSQGRLADLAERWVSGVRLDWSRLNPQGVPGIVSLPTYAFARTRCWLDVPETTSTAAAQASVAVSAQPAVQGAALATETDFETFVENELTQLVSSFLKVPADQMKPDDNLQKYGFDSILGMKMVGGLEKKYGQKVEVRALFEHPSIREMARHLIDSGIAVRPAQSEAVAAVAEAAPTREVVQEPLQPLELDDSFRQSLTLFLLGELKAGRITPQQALELEARVGKTERNEGTE